MPGGPKNIFAHILHIRAHASTKMKTSCRSLMANQILRPRAASDIGLELGVRFWTKIQYMIESESTIVQQILEDCISTFKNRRLHANHHNELFQVLHTGISLDDSLYKRKATVCNCNSNWYSSSGIGAQKLSLFRVGERL
jgi:hypothetical protein